MINKKYLILFVFILFPVITKASTYINDGNITQDTTFDKSGSPYILNDYVKVYPGVRLNIDSGVSIRAGTSTEEDFYPSISLANSVLDIRGSKSDRVSLENVGIYSDSSNISINNADLKQSGLFINRSKANIFNSSISKNTTALYTRLSEINIDSSVFTDNTTAIDIGPDKIFQAINKSKIKNGFKYGLGGEGNVNLEFLTSVPTTSMNISNTIFENNSDWAVHNLNESYFDLRNNWWGQNTGPIYVGPNKIVGNNNIEPWLNIRPELPLKPDTLCCSSILFIPGIESSRLYSTSTSKRLWEPLSNKDVERLYLDERGMSIDKNIYSKDIIDNFLGIYGIYKNFIRSMSSFVKKEKINDFSIYPYDWRRNISDIVDSGEKRATSTINLKNLIYDLASRSKTGKVTIVAHSNGGLIAKELIRQLEASGKTDIVDKIISIAVPYLGTPKAVLSLLHGYDQSILSGFIMSESNARGLAQNMFSAYNLLPSPAYFRNLLAPVISFASSTIYGINNGSYPKDISSYEEQLAFINDYYNNRSDPNLTNTIMPIKGNSYIGRLSKTWRNIFDLYHWPNNIPNYSIVGYGENTPKTLEYFMTSTCAWSLISGLLCGYSPTYKAGETKLGDGTVVASSAAYDARGSYFLDLPKISKYEDNRIVHANITESSTTQRLIQDIITDRTEENSLIGVEKVFDSSVRYEHVSNMVISTHSPVSLHVYDSVGRHTGLSTLPQGMDPALYSHYESNIPDSSIKIIGEGYEKHTYITLPKEDSYKVVVEGEGIGTFTLNIEKYIDNEKISSLDFTNIPIVPTAVASTSISFSNDNLNLSTSTTLSLDLNSDGISDLRLGSNEKVDQERYIKIFKESAKKIFSDKKRFEHWQNKIDQIIDKWKKNKSKIKTKKFDVSRFYIGHKVLGKMIERDREDIMKVYEDFLDLSE